MSTERKLKFKISFAVALSSAVVGAVLCPANPAYASPKTATPPPTAAAVDDPLAFLEGPVHCDEIRQQIQSRYSLSDNSPAHVAPMLEEEFRYVKGETCENARYAECGFSWCGKQIAGKARAQAAAAVGDSSDLTRLDNEESKILKALEDTSAKLENTQPAASAATESNHRSLEKDSQRARLRDDIPAVVPPAVEASAAVVPAAARNIELPEVAPAVEPPSIDPQAAARDALAKLVQQHQDLRQRRILAQLEREQARGINWEVIAVPGSDRRPRLKVADPSELSNPVRSLNGDGSGSRTITPGIDPSVPRQPAVGTQQLSGMQRPTGRVGNPYVSGQMIHQGGPTGSPYGQDNHTEFQRIIDTARQRQLQLGMGQ
jgi:hypothetical protein